MPCVTTAWLRYYRRHHTLGRPLVAGLVVGVILGDVQTGIIVGAAIQLAPHRTRTWRSVSADVRAVSKHWETQQFLQSRLMVLIQAC